MKAGYKKWMEFNLVQRVHYNYLENFTQIVVMLLFAGLHFPITTTVIGGFYFLGRCIYTIGYEAGPQYRIKGFLMCFIVQQLLPIFTIVSLIMLNPTGISFMPTQDEIEAVVEEVTA